MSSTPPPPPGYPPVPPPPGQPPTPPPYQPYGGPVNGGPQRTNGMSIASLVLSLVGLIPCFWAFPITAVLGVIFGAAYFLGYYERSMLGPLGKHVSASIKDLHMREITIALSLSIMILWIGLFPSPFLRMMNGSIQALVDRLDRAKVASVDTTIRVPTE